MLYFEDLTSKIPGLVKIITTRAPKITPEKAIEIINKLSKYDPTTEYKGQPAVYLQWIVHQFLKRFLKDEDGMRLKNTLALFEKNKRKERWKSLGGLLDINQYKDWKELEQFVNTNFKEEVITAPETTPESEQEKLPEGVKHIFKFRDPKVPEYDVYEITTPAAAAIFGHGTNWCTASLWNEYDRGKHKQLPRIKVGDEEGYPVYAAEYLQTGPLYIIKKDGKLYAQGNFNYDQFKNVEDMDMKKASPAFDYFLAHFEESLPENHPIRQNILDLRRSSSDYPGRPPIILGKTVSSTAISNYIDGLKKRVPEYEQTLLDIGAELLEKKDKYIDEYLKSMNNYVRNYHRNWHEYEQLLLKVAQANMGINGITHYIKRSDDVSSLLPFLNSLLEVIRKKDVRDIINDKIAEIETNQQRKIQTKMQRRQEKRAWVGESTAAPVAPTKPATKPATEPATKPAPAKPSRPDPFRPPQPKHLPRPKARKTETENLMPKLMARVCEAYEDEAHPGTVKFWQEMPPEHPFSKHPILSKYGHALSKGAYEYTTGKMTQRYSMRELYNIFMRIVQIESQHKDELVALAKQITSKIWGVPPDILNAELTDEMSFDEDEEPEEETEEEVSPEIEKEIQKRVTMNTLTQGSSVHAMLSMHHLVEKAIQKIDPRLMELYGKLASGSVHAYWLYDIAAMLQQLANTKVGVEKVEFSETGEPVIMARAIVFPVLCQELSKGVMEVLTMHHISGLDEPTQKAVIKHADKLEDEPWLIQVGPQLWRAFLKVVPKKIKLAELISTLSTKTPDEVHDLIEKVMDDPQAAQQIIEDFMTDDVPEPPEEEHNFDTKVEEALKKAQKR